MTVMVVQVLVRGGGGKGGLVVVGLREVEVVVVVG